MILVNVQEFARFTIFLETKNLITNTSLFYNLSLLSNQLYGIKALSPVHSVTS